MSRLWDPRAQPGRTYFPYVRELSLDNSLWLQRFAKELITLPTKVIVNIELSSEMVWWVTAGSSLSVSGVNILDDFTSLHSCVLDFSSRLSYFGQRHAPCLEESGAFAVRTFLCSGQL